MPSTTEIIKRLGDLEAFVKTLAVQTEIDTRIDTINDTLGVLQGDIEEIKAKVNVYEFPSDYQYILTGPELAFLQVGIKEVTKTMIELETLKKSLVRLKLPSL